MPKAKYPRYTINLGKDADGKRITKTFYGKTKKEAKQKAEAYKVLGASPPKHTLATVAAQYLLNNTDKTKEYRINAFVKSLGNANISEINAVDIEAVLAKIAVKNAKKANEGTAQRTLSRYLQALNQVFEYAERNRITTYNPCKYARLPQSTPPKIREALNADEVLRITNTISDGTLPALIMTFCGLRRGELAALTWGDVDFENKTLSVTKSYDYKNDRIKPPKSDAGIRTIPIPETLLKRLVIAKKGKKKADLVITIDGRRPKEHEWRTLNIQISEILGFKFTWHQLRHTYATLLYDAGIGVKEAQHLLGHASADVTMDIYTHLSEQKKKQSADKLDAFIDTFADKLQTQTS